MEWYERATGFWTWARHGRPMTRQWVRESVIERAQEFGAEYVIFGIHIGGYMAFQSDIAPPVPDMEDDVLGQLCEDGRAAGLKVLPYWMTTTGPNTIQLLEHRIGSSRIGKTRGIRFFATALLLETSPKP